MAGVRINRMRGFIDSSGKEIVKHQFREITDFREGAAAVLSIGKWGYIFKDGGRLIKTQFDEARSFSSGLAAVGIDKKWGLIDKNGIFVIPAVSHEIKNNTPALIAARKKN